MLKLNSKTTKTTETQALGSLVPPNKVKVTLAPGEKTEGVYIGYDTFVKNGETVPGWIKLQMGKEIRQIPICYDIREVLDQMKEGTYYIISCTGETKTRGGNTKKDITIEYKE